MARHALRNSGYEITATSNPIEVTSEFPSPDPHWAYTDEAGHGHRYENGYPTLDYIVDASHWCDGTEGIARHDPHEQVDESHYECLQCRERIKPGLVPGGQRRWIPGMVDYRAKVNMGNGIAEGWLTPDQYQGMRDLSDDDRLGYLRQIMADGDQVVSRTYG